MSENTLCTHCGTSNDSSYTVCSYCGANLQEQKPNLLGTLGLAFGIFGLFIFSWLGAFAWLWMVFVFFVFCVLGIVFSALSLKNNKKIGITGLVFSSLATAIQICWVIFAISIFVSA